MTDDAAEGVSDGVAGDAAHTGDAARTSDARSGDGRSEDAGSDDAYSGLIGAVPYALRSSRSWLFRSYGVVGTFLAVAVAVLFALSVVVLLGQTAAASGGSFTFSRAFFIFVGLTVVAPLVAPVLFVARRHRRGAGDRRYDATLGVLGYLFVSSLYVGLVISTPADQQAAVTGPLGPLVAFLYGLPRLAGLAPPLAVAVLVWLAGRRAT